MAGEEYTKIREKIWEILKDCQWNKNSKYYDSDSSLNNGVNHNIENSKSLNNTQLLNK
jgi:hypothetical protein